MMAKVDDKGNIEMVTVEDKKDSNPLSRMDFKARLQNAQNSILAPKDQHNDYGDYKYRSAEQILKASRNPLKEDKLVLVLNDEIVEIGGKLFVKATATVTSITTDDSVSVSAYALLSDHKGMSGDQCTGTASSYARKYALNGLFLLDDTKDTDTNEFHAEQEARAKAEAEETAKAQAKPITKTEESALLKKIGDDGAILQYILTTFKIKAVSELKAGELVRINKQWDSLVGAAHESKNKQSK